MSVQHHITVTPEERERLDEVLARRGIRARNCFPQGEKPKEALSAREMDVISFVAAGYTNRETAAEMFISTETVKSHIRNILPKLNAANRTHAVAIAVARGLLDVSAYAEPSDA